MVAGTDGCRKRWAEYNKSNSPLALCLVCEMPSLLPGIDD